MKIAELAAQEAKAVEKALEVHLSLVDRFGNSEGHLNDMELALLGYRGFAEKLAADAFYRLDYVLHPKLSALKPGEDLHLDGMSFGHVTKKRDGSLVATAIDDTGAQRFRIRWKPEFRPSGLRDDGTKGFDVTLQYCPEHDPQYEYAETIAHSLIVRSKERVESRSSGTLWSHDFFSFIEAMDVLRPALSKEILAMPKPKPMSDNIPFSHLELDRMLVLDCINLDGGLPGRLCQHVVSSMIESRGEAIMRVLTERSSEILGKLVEDGCFWGGTALTTRGRDNVFYAVPSKDGERHALFVNARNTSGPYTAFIMSIDDSAATATIYAAKGGKDIFRVVGAFVDGQEIEAPKATINLSTGRHDIGPEVMGTAILDLALCHLRFLSSDFEEVAKGEYSYEDVFEKVDDFKFFIEANEDFYLDEETEAVVESSL